MASKKCQCDELCTYYQSCCVDYMEQCKPQVTRGDVFTMPEDEYWSYDYPEETKNSTSTGVQSENTSLHFNLKPRAEETIKPTTPDPQEQSNTQEPEVGQQGVAPRPDTTDEGTSEFPEEELCSGKPFDAFTDLKNGSLFAFRGEYCYELDETAVRPGLPSLASTVRGRPTCSRVVSTGALRMVSWTLIIPETSLKASVAYQTTLTQP
ncbi:vitronectin, isoform CRA_a [Rattus norvegicus]|uniref:Vitronectin, isoform CRA_a n=1 Tax=Rattus norvegicus TaxID=10116 RepID=A6HH54_RAT|nr:vitronectin, isoform CRA_a [Rattus norvegicus]